ncbi:bifunctional 2-polyprenyl-6-hydroxyphenol methylase/3-demethylubiquinol 3-O-methyltransferase UbiG [Cellulomonas sp. Root485]|uniref:class I SAM-dependent methyltransferase n=1 Tax=Cellulomonas sp. Root485 TaxID=1736546 RepID=UPI0009E7A759|nr:class I SAM-dependent methyltransferase [Cellulomonas sp. Root485]
MDWVWDPSLYEGSAPHFAVGRMAYPAALADALRDALGLDGSGRLLDVGCGPGSLTVLLAPMVRSAVGVDADAGMIAEVRRSGAPRIEWRQLRAEELPADLGTFRLVTFAQSFHWMDQERVARTVRPMIEPGGAWVHVFAMTHRGAEGDDALPRPRPPWDAIDRLVAGYLGPVRRAGRGSLPSGTRGGEEDVMRDAGYRGPERLDVVRGDVVERSTEQVVSAVFSLSSSAPHLFGPRLPEFDDDLRRLLRSASPDGTFAERARDLGAVIWRP